MYTKETPYFSKIKERELLSLNGSSRKTYHICLEIEDPNFSFKVGDSLAVLPTNDPLIVEEILDHLKATGKEKIWNRKKEAEFALRDYLLYKVNLNEVSFHKILDIPKTKTPLVDLVKEHRPSLDEISQVLLPLMPRFYSIASSLKQHPNEAHLTVSSAEFVLNGRTHFGVGSDFLCRHAKTGTTPIPIYVQTTDHFTLPKDLNTPILMIGPGTGIAPFRAFLQERVLSGLKSLNWLFFGERNEATDFYYKEFLQDLEKKGDLFLSTAFSRDQDEKVYVQHKLLEEKEKVWDWIYNQKAVIYVCGDAQKMAKDVHKTLQKIASLEGGLSEESAKSLLQSLRKERRYLLDVY